MLALFLGLIVSAGLYFAYLWPSVEPSDAEPATVAADSPPAAVEAEPAPVTAAGAEKAGSDTSDEASSTS